MLYIAMRLQPILAVSTKFLRSILPFLEFFLIPLYLIIGVFRNYFLRRAFNTLVDVFESVNELATAIAAPAANALTLTFEDERKRHLAIFAIGLSLWATLTYAPWRFVSLAALSIIVLGAVGVTLRWLREEERRFQFVRHQDGDGHCADYRWDFFLTSVLLVSSMPSAMILAEEFGAAFDYGGGPEGLMPMTVFATEGFLRALLILDFNEVYGVLDFSPIEPATDSARHAAFSMRILFDLIVISGLIQLLKTMLAVNRAYESLAYTHELAARLGNRMRFALMRALSRYSNEAVIRNAARAMMETGLADHEKLLRKACDRATEGATRTMCLRAITTLFPEDSSDIARKIILTDRFSEPKIEALKSLNGLEPDSEDIEAALKALSDPAPVVRREAVDYLVRVAFQPNEHQRSMIERIAENEVYKVVGHRLRRLLATDADIEDAPMLTVS
ncbi:MAG: hypothetical protein AAFY15_02015 [Cyanobacteria bacterium J06648_11]